MLNKVDVKYFKMAVGLDRIGRETDIDISARCPICGDSKTKKNSKRLHLYSREGIDVSFCSCFNSGCQAENKTIFSFLRDFYPTLFEQYKRETFQSNINELSQNNSGSSDVFNFVKKEDSPKLEIMGDWENSEITQKQEIQEIKPVQTLDLSAFFKDIQNVPEGIEYIKTRGFDYSKLQKYGNWYYGYQDLKILDIVYKTTNSIIVPLYYNNEMYGFYSRNIESKLFATFMLDINHGYKIWNWFNIDKSKPVYIFEGIFDALSSGKDNIIALLGAKLTPERLAELSNPIFCLDNDETGLKNSLEYAKMSHKIFINPYKAKDLNQMFVESDINISEVIDNNIFTGISAVVKINSVL